MTAAKARVSASMMESSFLFTIYVTCFGYSLKMRIYYTRERVRKKVEIMNSCYIPIQNNNPMISTRIKEVLKLNSLFTHSEKE